MHAFETNNHHHQSFLQNNNNNHDHRNHRAMFALLIKILLKSLKQSGDIRLYRKVRAVISTCIQRNRMRDPHFSPLEDILEVILRDVVGDAYWQRAKDFQREFLLDRRRRACQYQQQILIPGPSLQI